MNYNSKNFLNFSTNLNENRERTGRGGNMCDKQKDSKFIPRHKSKYSNYKYTKYSNERQKLSDGIKRQDSFLSSARETREIEKHRGRE